VGDHFQVLEIKVPSQRPYIAEDRAFVVVRHGKLGNRFWDALGRGGFFAAVPDNAPRADIAYARGHLGAVPFESVTDAVNAAIDALAKERSEACLRL
jgi:hypothetical protein